VSLIEALVALLVLALGVMGLAGIQTRTLVEGRATNARSVAVQMADDLLDRMQANVEVRLAAPIPPAVHPYEVGWGVPTNCFNTGTTPLQCSGPQLAEFDLQQWKATLANLLPAGDARIFRSPTDPAQFGVLVGWSETQAKNQDGASAADATLFADAVSTRDGAGAVGTGVAGVDCPANLSCHLVYIRP
jgi:type IV pilus assembly protein PilV